MEMNMDMMMDSCMESSMDSMSYGSYAKSSRNNEVGMAMMCAAPAQGAMMSAAPSRQVK